MKACSVEGCERPHRCRGFCELHYDRMRRYGRLEKVRGEAGSGYLKDNGYRAQYNPTHILSGNSNYVYEHRLVLFNAIGFGPHLCALGGEHINWGSGLQVDHIDCNPENNVIENLRAVCGPCNTARAKAKKSVVHCKDCGTELLGTSRRKFCNNTCRQRAFQKEQRQSVSPLAA